jgi:hypothetical protein
MQLLVIQVTLVRLALAVLVFFTEAVAAVELLLVLLVEAQSVFFGLALQEVFLQLIQVTFNGTLHTT